MELLRSIKRSAALLAAASYSFWRRRFCPAGEKNGAKQVRLHESFPLLIQLQDSCLCLPVCAWAERSWYDACSTTRSHIFCRFGEGAHEGS